MATAFRTLEGFWSTFLEEQWDKLPSVGADPFEQPLLSEEELFEVVVRKRDVLVGTGDNPGFRFFVDAAEQTDFAQLLPRREDGCLRGYSERMQAELEGAEYGFILSRYYDVDREHWCRVRDFFRGLFLHTGVPAGGAEADIFVGDYRKSGLALHKDSQHVFTWVVHGRKRMLLWPFETFAWHPRGGPENREVQLQLMKDYELYRDAALVLEGGPGSWLYWPSSYWHTPDSQRGLCATVALGVIPHVNAAVRLADTVLSAVSDGDATLLGPEHAAHVQPPHRTIVPTSVEAVLQLFLERCSPARIRDELERAWLCQRSAYGIAPLLPDLELELSPHDRVQLELPDALVWLAREDGVHVGVHGTVVTLDGRHPNLVELLLTLARGTSEVVETLCHRFAGDATVGDTVYELDTDDVFAILVFLAQHGALTVQR